MVSPRFAARRRPIISQWNITRPPVLYPFPVVVFVIVAARTHSVASPPPRTPRFRHHLFLSLTVTLLFSLSLYLALSRSHSLSLSFSLPSLSALNATHYYHRTTTPTHTFSWDSPQFWNEQHRPSFIMTVDFCDHFWVNIDRLGGPLQIVCVFRRSSST